MPNPLYIIYFRDGTSYRGGLHIHDSKWGQIPDKPIKRLEYFISDGEGIILEDFESYLCFVEAEAVVARPVGNCPECNSKSKIAKKIIKYTNNTIRKELVARCTKCEWVGKVDQLKYNSNHSGDKFIYIMGLKKGKVTSYRMTLNGQEGKTRYQIGDFTKRILQLGKEYRGRPTNHKLWKIGIS